MPPPKRYTTAEAAQQLGCSVRTVQRKCQEYEIGVKHGRDLWLTAADVTRLRGLIQRGPGNPQFGDPEAAREAINKRWGNAKKKGRR